MMIEERWPDSVVLDAFHEAGLFLPPEREEYDARIEAEAKEVELRAARLERRHNIAIAVAANLSVLLAGVGMSYSYGRAAESELTLQAYATAEYATELLRQYIPVGEQALATCVASDEAFQEFLETDPVWGARVRAMIASAD